MTQLSPLKLSFCIATFNRADFLSATLGAIIAQATSDCEIVVSDNASTDNTGEVVSEYARRFDRLRYIRQDANAGLDRNFDRAVELARGEYCWLMPDDDLLKPGAVAAVLDAMDQDVSLIVVNAEFRDFTMERVLDHGVVDFESDRVYGSGELDRLFLEAGFFKGYIGGIVMRRVTWMARDREKYFGSYSIHIGLIYQSPLPGKTVIIAKPFISVRMGNMHTWWRRLLDLHIDLQRFVMSLALSESIKQKFCSLEPWRDPQLLLWLRALGAYSLAEYRRRVRPMLRSSREMLVPIVIAVLPGLLVNTLFLLYYRITRRSRGMLSPEWVLQLLTESRSYHRERQDAASSAAE